MLKFFDRPDVVIQEIAGEAIAIIAVAAALFFTRRTTYRWICAADRKLGRIARRQWLSVTLIGLLALVCSASFTLIGHMPQPLIHDEFCYLLAADTFAHGRLSNPTHPLWVHFESMYITQNPTYASKYPPAQGMMMAFGQVIGGHPIVGVWISTALACAALCWMLLAWFPPRWAMVGSLLAALHPGILIQWGQSYWGGAMAMMGGALVFGAIRRIMRQPRVRHAILLGAGLAVLANSRPYEGLVLSLPMALVLFVWMLGKSGPQAQVSISRIVLPILMVLAVTGGWMAFYNLRVTGEALLMPDLANETVYAMAPHFLWQNARPEPVYRHDILRFHHDRRLNYYTAQRSLTGLVIESAEKVKGLWKFYQGSRGLRLVLTIPLFFLPWVLKNPWQRFALLCCGILAVGMAMSTYVQPHYAAPMIGLVCVLLLQSTRRLGIWRWRGKPMGQFVVWAFWIVAAASFVTASVQQVKANSTGWGAERAQIVAQLRRTGRPHLVIVPQRPLHLMYRKRPQEWVYNDADIDASKIVWARSLDAVQDRKLLEYFKGREAWILDVRQFPPTLVPY